jgi:diguanylate cyclase (GGDEF)-like protein
LEGDTFARDLYCGFLRSEGYKVRGEPDTALALAALEKEPADVLVAQVGATEPYSGMLLAEARRRVPGVDLIALIERGSVDGAARALRDGACEYLLKPVTQAALGLAVRRSLELQKLRIERPVMDRELRLWQRCQQLAWGARAEGLEERIARMLVDHARAESAVVLRAGSHGEMHAVGHVNLDRESADKIAASWGEKKKRGPVPLVVEVPKRFVIAIFGAREDVLPDLQLLARWGGVAAEMAGKYGHAASAEAAMDPLSGLYGSDYLIRVLDDEIARTRAGGPPVAVLAIDVDGFRAVNDAHGHLVGGRALIEAARILERALREIDLVARVGADEFAAALLHTDSTGARVAAERIRRAFESHLFLVREGLELKLTVSIGVASCPSHGTTARSLVAAAEDAVARVKTHGRNGVAVAEGAPVGRA